MLVKALKNKKDLNNNKPLAAICAAPMVFGNLGLLKNKNATCYPGFEDELHGAIITGNDVEEADNIITGKGAGVAIQFALKIVEKLKGKKLADELSRKMIVKMELFGLPTNRQTAHLLLHKYY